ncbi:MAG: class I SAM-dependent methyltransferase [Candidatus Dojkabacteria bacterium]|nr:class I SAM-dependent methyltransferase [Candidatus Dojkabacteria bacterium]
MIDFLAILDGLTKFFLIFSFILVVILATKEALTGEAPYIPSRFKTVLKMIDIAGDLKDKVVLDLGSGDGRVLFLCAKRGAKKCIGIEKNFFLYLFSNIVAQIFFKNKVKIIHGNMWNYSIKNTDILFVYLLPNTINKVEKKILKEFKKDKIIIISNRFKFPNLSPTEIDEKLHIYKYVVTK